MTANASETVQPTKSRRWLAIALFLSVGINLLFIGLVAGHALHRPGPMMMGAPGQFGGPGRYAGPPPGEGAIEGLLQSLPEQVQQEMRKTMRERRAQSEPKLRELQEARRKVRQAMVAEPFVPQRLSEAYAEVRKRGEAVQEDFHEAIVEVAGKLPPEGRRRLADMRRGPGGPGGPGGPHTMPMDGHPPPSPPPTK